MPDTELLQKVNDLHTAVEAMRKANDERLKTLETKGHAPADLVEKVDKANKDITGLLATADSIKAADARIARLETALSRTGGSVGGGGREVKSFDGKRALTDDEVKARDNMVAYVRRGETKAMSVGDDPNGGYLVPDDMSGRIIARIFETSPVRQYANQQTLTTDSLEGPYDDDEAEVLMTTEQGARSETGTPKIGIWKIPVHEGYAKPKVTQKLLDDSAVNIEAWLATKLGDRFARKQNNQFLLGTGVGMPRGMLTYAASATIGSRANGGTIMQVNTGSNGELTSDFIVKLPYKLKDAYRSRGAYFMSREGIEKARLLKDAVNGRYLWMPGWGDIVSGQPQTLNGYRIGEFNDLAAFTTGSLSAMFGDLMEAYQIVDRQGIRVLRDPFSAKPFVEFYTTMRWGGDVLNFEALVIGKASA